MDNINKAGKDGESTRVLMKPEVVRTQLRDVKSLIVEAGKSPDTRMLRTITKGVFGPSETSFINQRFAKDRLCDTGCPDITKAMSCILQHVHEVAHRQLQFPVPPCCPRFEGNRHHGA